MIFGRDRLPQHRAHAFTLIELLLVVAIIAILASLLLPTLAKAKSQGYRVKCMSNLKQLALTSTIYSGDNEDRLVTNNDGDGRPYACWVGGSFHGNPADATNRFLLLDSRRSLFAPYITSTEIYKCPSDHALGTSGQKTHPRVRSYGLNMYVGWEGAAFNTGVPNLNYKIFKKQSEISDPSPSNLLTFMDVNPNSVCRPFFGIFIDPSLVFHYPAAHHGRAGVNAFSDGHVESRKWYDSRTLDPGDPAVLNYHMHRIPCPNNADFTWIQQRATSKK